MVIKSYEATKAVSSLLGNACPRPRTTNDTDYLSIRHMGLDMVGLLKAVSHIHWLIVIDKVTKWIEAKPITKITIESPSSFSRHYVKIRCHQ